MDSGIWLASTVRRFEDGAETDPPWYDFIVSVFNSYFDPSWTTRPGMEDRTYFSARAVLAICVSTLVNCPERSPAYPLAGYNILSNRLPEDRDLKSSRSCFGPYSTITHLPTISPTRKTPLHTHILRRTRTCVTSGPAATIWTRGYPRITRFVDDRWR